MGQPSGIIGEFRVRDPILTLQRASKIVKLSIVASSDHDMAIRHRKYLIGHYAGVGIAHPLRALSSGEVIEVLIGLRGQHAVK